MPSFYKGDLKIGSMRNALYTKKRFLVRLGHFLALFPK